MKLCHVLLLLLPSCGLAANPPIVFTVFSPEPLTGLSYRPRPDRAPEPLVFYPTARSPDYAYAGPSRLELLVGQDAKHAGEVVLPKGVHRLLLIVTPRPGPNGARRLHVTWVSDGSASHPAGTLRLINDSGIRLTGLLGQRSVSMESGADRLIPAESGTDINLRAQVKGRSYQACSLAIRVPPAERALLLLLPPYQRGAVEVQWRLLVDKVSPEKSIR